MSRFNCNFILDKTTKDDINELQRLQNNLARVVLQKPGRTHSEHPLAQLHWLPVGYRIEYKTAMIAYKALEFGQPRYLADVSIHQQQQDRATRSEGQLSSTSAGAKH